MKTDLLPLWWVTRAEIAISRSKNVSAAQFIDSTDGLVGEQVRVCVVQMRVEMRHHDRHSPSGEQEKEVNNDDDGTRQSSCQARVMVQVAKSHKV